MDSEHSVKGTLLVLICYVSYSLQVPHEFIVEDERVFSDCINAPPGIRNISGLYDLSHVTFTMDEHGTLLEGNVTTVWNIQPTDVLLAEIFILYFDRWSWTPTVLNMKTKTRGNTQMSKDVKDKCLNFETTLLLEPFYMEIVLGLDMPLRNGRYMKQIAVTAQDTNDIRREDSICFAIREMPAIAAPATNKPPAPAPLSTATDGNDK